MRARCDLCLFFDCCHTPSFACDGYHPASLDDSWSVDEVIEDGRAEFYEEWVSYISEYDDDYFFN